MEIWMLSHLPSSGYFPRLHGLMITDFYCIIVMEAIYDGIELLQYLTEIGHISDENDAKELLRSVSESISLLHSIGIIHRDLKLENIFLIPSSTSKQVNIKVIDFGLATWLPFENTTEIISYEMKRNWDKRLLLFWELLSEYGRSNSFLKSKKTLIALRTYKEEQQVPADLLPNWNSLLDILFNPEPLNAIYQSNISLYEQTKLTERCGSEEYAAPELLLQAASPYSSQLAEIWSLGIIFYAVITGRFPFQYTTASSYRQTVAKGVIEWDTDNYPSVEVRRFIEKMLEVSPSDRFSLQDVVNNTWFN